MLLEKYLARERPSPALPCGYSFERHMRFLAEETSIPLRVLKPDRATFEPTFQGRSFVTILVHQGPSIYVGMLSNIRFPGARHSSAVRDMIQDIGQPRRRVLCHSVGRTRRVVRDRRGLRFHGSADAGDIPPEPRGDDAGAFALVDAWIVEEGYAPETERSNAFPRRPFATGVRCVQDCSANTSCLGGP